MEAVMLVLSRIRFGLQLRGPHFEEMAVVERTVQHGGNLGAITEQFSPVLHGAGGS